MIGIRRQDLKDVLLSLGFYENNGQKTDYRNILLQPMITQYSNFTCV